VFVRGKSIREVWGRILDVVWYQGEEFASERGATKEVLNLVASVASPTDESVEGFPMGAEELDAYAKQLLDSDKKDFVYTYGERLRAWGGGVTEPVDQVAEVISKLKDNPNSRRATCVTWIPPVDANAEEVPCLITLDFKNRGGVLHATALFRSNDMFGAWPANAYGLNKVNEHVASAASLKAGSLTTHSISAHVYDHDYKNIKKILGV